LHQLILLLVCLPFVKSYSKTSLASIPSKLKFTQILLVCLLNRLRQGICLLLNHIYQFHPKNLRWYRNPVKAKCPLLTRSKSKRKSIVEESSLSKRPKQMVSSENSNLPVALKEKVKLETEIVQLKARTSSRRSSNASPPGRLQCVIEGCSSDAQANSVYCSDECIAKHVRDSLHAMSEN
jgi:hypothetical protein